MKCRAINRIPIRHLADLGSCGKCRAVLHPLEAPIEINSETQFDEIVGGSRVPVLVDFWAAWCGPSRALAPEVAQVAHNLAGRALVLKVDTDNLIDLAERYQVDNVPSFALFSGGRLVRQLGGAIEQGQLEKWAIAPQ